ncbi:antitoxin [Campylobacterota bacterium]|nr:antitoxin [Campylobacterota bacterium]
MTAPINVGAFEAKTHFSQLLEQVQLGAQFVITRHGKKVARLVAIEEEAVSSSEITAKLSVLREQDFAKNGYFDIRAAIEDGRR